MNGSSVVRPQRFGSECDYDNWYIDFDKENFVIGINSRDEDRKGHDNSYDFDFVVKISFDYMITVIDRIIDKIDEVE
jgi:hypothetical protein